jgi:hypothetical protein
MERHQVLEIPLPEAPRATDDDVELLGELCRVILGVRHESGAAWRGKMRKLEEEGWDVQVGLMWVAQARREGHLEQALGRSRDKAFNELCEMAMLSAVDGCP